MNIKTNTLGAKTLSGLLILGLVLSSCPITAKANDVDTNTAITTEVSDTVVTVDSTTEAVDDNVNSIPTNETTEVEDITSDIDEPPITDKTTTEATTENSTEVSTETTEATTETIIEENLIVFDHMYSEVDTSIINTTDLFVQTSDPTVFSKNTNVVSNYDDVYTLSFDSVEQARFAYSYYFDKVTNITDMSNIMTLSTDDVADLSNINTTASPDDAIANLSEITTTNKSGYIALIDTGANADINYSVVGDDTSDTNGHGTLMLNYIKEENPTAKVMSIKIFNGNTASAADVYAGIRLAIDSNVSVINLSFVGANIEQNAIVKDIINEAINSGITVIGAAGNYNKDAKSYIPGCIDNVITVGAVNNDGTKYSSSNYNADLYVIATSTSEATARYSGIYTSESVSTKVFTTLTTNTDDNKTNTHGDKKVA